MLLPTGEPIDSQSARRRVLIVLIPPVFELDVVAPTQVLAIANRMAGGLAYDVEMATTGDSLTAPGEGGLISFTAHKLLADAAGPYDSILLACGVGNRHLRDPALTAWLQAEAPRARRVGGICVGGFQLAEAGLLDGRRATAHWRHVEEFAQRHPQVRVMSAPIWIQDGHYFTSAGVTAGFDLALGWVEADLGPAIACDVARQLVLFARRSGDEAQVSEVLAAQAGERRQVRELVGWIYDNLQRPLNVETLASRAAMSSRTLERSFAREIGCSPARFLLEARIRQARRLLATSSRSLDQVARSAGFANADAMRRAFRRFDGSLPRSFRRDPERPAPEDARASP